MLMLHMHMGIIMFIIVAANFIARNSFPLRMRESYHVAMHLSTPNLHENCFFPVFPAHPPIFPPLASCFALCYNGGKADFAPKSEIKQMETGISPERKPPAWMTSAITLTKTSS